MKHCATFACQGKVLDGELCPGCRAYLAGFTYQHPTLIRPKWELVPRLDTIYRALTLPTSEPMNKAALGTLQRLIDELRRK